MPAVQIAWEHVPPDELVLDALVELDVLDGEDVEEDEVELPVDELLDELLPTQ